MVGKGWFYLSNTASKLLLLAQLLVGSSPWVDSQGLGVSYIGQVGDELEAINNLRPSHSTTLNTKTQHTSEATGEVSLRESVGAVGLETGIRNPRDVRRSFQPLRKLQGILSVSLCTQTQCLDSLDELESSEWVQRTSEITEDFYTHADRECDGAESIPELEAVITW